MKLSVKGKQVDVGDALRTHVESALALMIEKYFPKSLETSAVFSREARGFRVDISSHAGRGITVQSHGQDDDPYVAFDLAAARIAKQLRRYKRRLVNHHKAKDDGAQIVRARQYVLAEDTSVEEDESENTPVIVAESTTDILHLTVSEAVMHMNLADLPVLMFRNKAHGGLNAVFKRGDGNVGWVDPENSLSASVAATDRR